MKVSLLLTRRKDERYICWMNEHIRRLNTEWLMGEINGPTIYLHLLLVIISLPEKRWRLCARMNLSWVTRYTSMSKIIPVQTHYPCNHFHLFFTFALSYFIAHAKIMNLSLFALESLWIILIEQKKWYRMFECLV